MTTTTTINSSGSFDLAARAALHNTLILAPRSWPQRVHSGDAAVDKAFQAISWDIALHVLSLALSRDTGRRALFVVGGHAQLEPLQRHLSNTLPGVSVAAPDGYADIVAFMPEWQTAWDASRLLLVTGPTFLHVLFHGLLDLRRVSLLLFEDVTAAHRQHPYCVAMRHFYTPTSAQRLLAGEGASLPLVLAFALDDCDVNGLRGDGEEDDAIFAKRQSMQRLADYQRDFHAVLLSPTGHVVHPEPLPFPAGRSRLYMISCSSLEDKQAYMAKNGHRYSVVFGKGCQNPADDSFLDEFDDLDSVLIADWPDAARLMYLVDWSLARASGDVAVLFATANVCQDAAASQDVDSGCQSKDAAFLLSKHCLEGLLAAIPRRAAGDVSEVNRDGQQMARLRSSWAVFAELESIARCPFISDHGPMHLRTSTGALLVPSMAVDMLLRFCSALPKDSSGDATASGLPLKVRTYLVKRVDDSLKRTIDERIHHLTRIRLPTRLHAIYPALPVSLDGPVVLGRSASQRRAAYVACRALLALGAMNEHLVVSSDLRQSLISQNSNAAPAKGLPDDAALFPEHRQEVGESSLPTASEFELTPFWQAGPTDEHRLLIIYRLSTHLITRAQVVAEHAEAGSKGTHSKEPSSTDFHLPLWLTPESRILIEGVDFFNSSTAATSWAIALPSELPENLIPSYIPLGTEHFIKVTLQKGNPVRVSDAEFKMLSRAQAVFFGAFNIKPIQVVPAVGSEEGAAEEANVDAVLALNGDDLSAAVQEDEQQQLGMAEDLFGCELPPELHSMYLFIPLTRQSHAATLEDWSSLDRAWAEYNSLVEHVRRAGSEAAHWASVGDYLEEDEDASIRIEDDFVVDWPLIRQCLSVHDPLYQQQHAEDRNVVVTLLDYVKAIERFVREKPPIERILLPTYQLIPPQPLENAIPEEDAIDVIDFCLFALKRLLVYAPYNCLYYRVKRLCPALNPASPFASKTAAGCTSYGQYVEQRYGCSVTDWTQPLVEVRRVENFAEPVSWIVVLQSAEDALAPGRKRRSAPSAAAKRRRDCTKEQQRSVLIGELAVISPLSYAMARMGMILPRLFHDIERQCTIRRFFLTTLPAKGNDAGSRLCKPAEELPSGQCFKLKLPHMVSALTGPTAALPYDYERLEVLGDSLLKYTCTIDVFVRHGSYGEGRLSAVRQAIISNANLTRLGMSLGIHRWATLVPFFAKLWTPPTLLHLIDTGKDAPYDIMCAQLFDPWCRWRRIAEVEARSNMRGLLYRVTPTGQLLLPITDEEGGAGDDNRASAAIVPGQPASAQLLQGTQTDGGKKKRKELQQLRRFGQVIPSKCIADMIEACIAIFYLDGGHEAAVDFMQRCDLLSERAGPSELAVFAEQSPMRLLGLGTEGVGQTSAFAAFPSERAWLNDRRLGSAARFCDAELMLMGQKAGGTFNNGGTDGGKLQMPTGPLAAVHRAASSIGNVQPYVPTEEHFPFDAVEAKLGYRFRERRLLFIACTHVSVDPLLCNERLEWLGDAALDWLVTRHYWHDYGHLTPAQLTEARQAAVNNNTFASIAVAGGFHRWLRIDTAFLQLDIEHYASSCVVANKEGDQPSSQRDAPKCLGDLLEALAGALLIDCRFDDQVFARVFKPLLTLHLKHPQDRLVTGDQSNPIRAFLTTFCRLGIPRTAIQFIYHDIVPGVPTNANSDTLTQSKCQIAVRSQVIAEAMGNTRAAAKKAASIKALEHIRSDDNWRQFV